MAKQIIIKEIISPVPGNIDDDIDYLCKSLGYLSDRDKQNTAGKIFRLLAKEACKPEKCLTSDEIADKINLTRGAIVHHLNNFISAGIVVKEHNKYRLRSTSLQKSLEDIRKDIDRIMEQMIKIAKEIDEELGYYYR